MAINDYLIIAATLTGPIAAVQVQKWIERSREKRSNQLLVFRVLMMTRALRAGSNEHVQALNLIDFYFGGNAAKEKAVVATWRLYHDFLCTRLPADFSESEARSHNIKGQDLLADLLLTISEALSFRFDKVQLLRGAYYPQGQADDSGARALIIKKIAGALADSNAIPVQIKVDTETLGQQTVLRDSLIGVLTGQQAVKVSPERTK